MRANDSVPTCYDHHLAGDGTRYCVGEIDERALNKFCQLMYPLEKRRRFRCYNSSVFLTPEELCDGVQHCPNSDDELGLCPWLANYTAIHRPLQGFLC